MYFKPSKKTYYRFPSAQSVNDFDAKDYFPEKSNVHEENIRFDDHFSSRRQEHQSYYDL